MLQELGITVGANNQAGRIFENLFPSFWDLKYEYPSEYVSRYWNEYLRSTPNNNNTNGKVFEYILATLCVREGILPLYLSAKVAFVPNVIYDLMFYTSERGPICWSVKTSLRERYKQADLESIALKYVHRKALSYLITLNESEADSVRGKIRSGDVIGLDKVVVATSNEFNQVINELKSFDFQDPPTVRVIDSNQVVTRDRVDGFLRSRQ